MTEGRKPPAGGCCCGASWSEAVGDEQIVNVFERVRDIPFSFAPHTDAETLLRHGSGTCAPKHALLAQEYVRLDDTFDRPLKEFGFVVTEGWDGRSSMPLVVVPLSRVETDEPPARKEAVLGIQHRTALPRDVLARVNAWLDGVRQPREVQHG
jgi:hypothetical protein